MKKSAKASPKQASPTPKPEQPKAPAATLVGQTVKINGGKALADFTGRTTDSRYRGWICKPDGTRVEKIIVADIAEAEARVRQLIAKGAL